MRRLLGGKPRSRGEFSGELSPAETFYAVGDVHGQISLLASLLGAIRAERPEAPILLVGDYIDRGEDSAAVLRHLKDAAAQKDSSTICLLGNHEQMLLDFIDSPERRGDAWMANGGLQTMASFGIGLKPGKSHEAARNALAEAMGDDLISWIRGLPRYWMSGNVAVTHAGADPFRPIEDQPSRYLLWGHPAFRTTPRQDGKWVVHGHFIVDRPRVSAGRVAIDTGAYATGRLTAARISADGVSFMTA